MKFSESIIIGNDPEYLFDLTQDYSQRLNWDTFLKEARLLNNAPAAARGVRSWCVARNGLGMETEYVTFNRPHVTAVRLTNGPYMFSQFAASWQFRERQARSTEVIFTYSLRLRFPFNVAAILIRQLLRAEIRRRLKDLKEYSERSQSPVRMNGAQ